MYDVPSLTGQRSLGAGTTPAEPSGVGFESFFDANHARLFSALFLVTGSRADAEELMQEAFLKLWERWDRVRDLEDPVGYLYRTAMNAFRRRYRRALVAVRRAVRPPEPADDLRAIEDRDAVLRALRGLKPMQRAALVLTSLRDYSSEEAARMLGTSAANVRMLSARARAEIRAKAGEDR